MTPLRTAALVLACALPAAPAAAQDAEHPAPTLDVQRYRPAAGDDGFAFVEAARLLPAGHLALQLGVDYAHRPASVANLELDRTGGLVDGLLATQLRVALGVAGFVEVDVSMAVLQVAAVGPLVPDVDPGAHVSTGDLEIAGRFRLLDEDEAPVGVVLSPFLTVPTGRPAVLLSRSVPTFGGRAAFSGRWSLIRAAVHLGYRVSPSGATRNGALSDDEVVYGAAVGVAVPGVPVVASLELSGAVVVGPGRADVLALGAPAAALAPFELGASARVQLPASLSLIAGASGGLTPSFGVPVVRGFATLTWTTALPSPAGRSRRPLRVELEVADDTDTDGDEVPDVTDVCPDVQGLRNEPKVPEGCPRDTKVRVRGKRILLSSPVVFSGVTRVSEASYPLLDDLARLLVEHPEIGYVRVGGHGRNDDRELTRLRALEVVKLLITGGVDPTRLEAVGFGNTKPDRDGVRRERIEIQIVETEPVAAAQ